MIWGMAIWAVTALLIFKLRILIDWRRKESDLRTGIPIHRFVHHQEALFLQDDILLELVWSGFWGQAGTPGLPAEEKTIATLLQEQGYRTGLLANGIWVLIVSMLPMLMDLKSFGFLAVCVDYYSHIFIGVKETA